MSPEAARISSLRMHLLELHPFWGYLLLNTSLIANSNLNTIAATDGHRRVWFNPERTRGLSIKQLGFVMLHEICHHVQSSFTHTHGRNLLLWNHAIDYAANQMLLLIHDASFSAPLYHPPANILLNRRFDGLTAESIYECLLLDTVHRKNNLNQLSLPFGHITLEGVQVADHGGGIDVHLPVPMTKQARIDLETLIQRAVAHWEVSYRLGDVPPEVIRLFGTRPLCVPWRKMLRRYVHAALIRDDSDPQRPSRHWLAEGVVVEGISGERVRTIVVSLDPSGFMSPTTIRETCTEIRAIAAGVQEIHVVVVDAKTHEVVNLDQIEIFNGRDSFDDSDKNHIPLFNWIEQQGLQPDVFIGVTDLYGMFPHRSPPYPVLWVTPFPHEKPPFGRVIEAEEDPPI